MAESPAHTDLPDVAALTYEQAVAELESIIDRIESGEASLEESITAYERGVALRKHCEGILNAAEQRVEELTSRLETKPLETKPTEG